GCVVRDRRRECDASWCVERMVWSTLVEFKSFCDSVHSHIPFASSRVVQTRT
ncbi:hypothetical protein MKW94_001131, partial [Papaver nudicaule]|nr:hypothetical protein [Papaver nudicaule]